MWAFEYPDGTRTLNEIHVPVNKPVRLVMTSEDVIHSFFVPDFRVKHGRGSGPLYRGLVPADRRRACIRSICTEYCGKGHSDMLAQGLRRRRRRSTPNGWPKATKRSKTMTPHGTRQNWCTRTRAATPATRSTARKGQGPSWKGIFGQTEKMHDGKNVDGGRELYPGIDPESAGEGRAGLRSRSCRRSRACFASAKFRALIEFIKSLK